MGQMRFWASGGESSAPHAEERAFLAGLEGIPWRSDNWWEDEELVLERDVDESGWLCLPWPAPARGELMLFTASLRERWAPYHLPVEIARGLVNHIRNQLENFRQSGLAFSEQAQLPLRQAGAHFVAAAAVQAADREQATACAEQAIAAGLEAASRIAHEYVKQMLDLRHKQTGPLGTMFAGALVARPLSREETQWHFGAFNSAKTSFTWRDTEPIEGEFDWSLPDTQFVWQANHHAKICAGPLLDLRSEALPDWLALWRDDFDHLTSAVRKYVETVVRRYRRAPHVWLAAAGFNTDHDHGFLHEEQRLRLAVAAIEAVRFADSRTPVVVAFDQPFGEYLGRQLLDLSPLHIADALLRADLGLAGLGLEINYGYWPDGTPARDLLELSRQLDRWSLLQMPLLIFLSMPSSDAPDPLARRKVKPESLGSEGPPTLAQQAETAKDLIELCLAKPDVHGVIWNQMCDGSPHQFPHGGWLDQQGRPKPLLDVLTKIGARHLA